MSLLLASKHFYHPMLMARQIPNEVTDYFLQRVGVECHDPRLLVSHTPTATLQSNQQRRKRLLSLAAQKFVSDIAADAFQHARIRTNAAGGRGRAPMGMIRVRISLSYSSI